MKRNSWLLPGLLLIFLPIRSRGQGQINPKTTQKYIVSQLQTDLIILKEALVKAHPGLFWYQTEKQFEDRFKQVYSSIDRPLTEIDFYKLIRPFVSDVKCVHTNVRFSNTTLNYFIDSVKYVPITIELINHKVYIQKEYSGNTGVLPGMELIQRDTSLDYLGSSRLLDSIDCYNCPAGDNYYNDIKYYVTIKITSGQEINEYTFRYYGPDNAWKTAGSSQIFICYAYDKDGNGGSEGNSGINRGAENLKKKLIDVFETELIKKVDQELKITHTEGD